MTVLPLKRESANRSDLRLIPKGYKLLIEFPVVEEKTSGGIIKPQSTTEIEGLASVVGRVVAMGPDAYADEKKFPSGPYCKVGDWIVMRSFGGTRIKVDDREYRLINDDTVEAVTADPSGIRRG